MPINRGDMYWVRLQELEGVPHPYVVVQDDLFNHSRVTTVIICALTSNLERVSMPGNVLIEAGEANLPKASVVEVSKISSIEKTALGAYIGTLSDQQVKQILAGIRFVQAAFAKPD